MPLLGALNSFIVGSFHLKFILFFFNSQDSVLASNFLSATISIAGSIQLIWILINLKKNNKQKINNKLSITGVKAIAANFPNVFK